MSGLDRLAACAGRWEGSSRLHDPHTGKPEDSVSTAVLAPLLGGQFIRVDYTWCFQGAAQVRLAADWLPIRTRRGNGPLD